MSEPAIDVVHVGSASRDLTDDDPRGWRLGGGASYSALTTARLGLRTAALIGVDADAAGASELDLLREAGVEIRLVPLAEGPVFRNRETRLGRVQDCHAVGRPLPTGALPPPWRSTASLSLVPVAGELADSWASVVPPGATLALGWQGWLRRLVAGRTVARRAPRPSPLLERADLVGVSQDDLAPGTPDEDLLPLLRHGARLLVTDGPAGGRLLRPGGDGWTDARRYEAIAPHEPVDPTGAGDVFLAALLATVVRPSTIVALADPDGSRLRFAAAAASLVVEAPGLHGVPDRRAVLARLAAGP
jgi:sugar/nucleoside kinase (ribokinase family)